MLIHEIIMSAYTGKDAISIQPIIHSTIADAINAYYFNRISLQTFIIVGTVESGPVVMPVMVPCANPVLLSTTISTLDVEKIFTTSKNIWPDLFDMIGVNVARSYKMWQFTPYLSVPGTCELNTKHFEQYGNKFINWLSKLDLEKYFMENSELDINKDIWEKFEELLDSATNMIASYEIPLAGPCLNGMFTGVCNVKL